MSASTAAAAEREVKLRRYIRTWSPAGRVDASDPQDATGSPSTYRAVGRWDMLPKHAWLQAAEAVYPMQNTPMYHYGIASAMGYALSMFSETLRDRKLVTLEQDLLILIIGFCFPMVSVVIDGLTYGDAVTISPPEYWALFGNFVPGM